jgi:hypothetical protein
MTWRSCGEADAAKGVLVAGEDLVTTDHVLVETWLLLQRWAGATFDHHFAVYRFGPGRRHAFEVIS